MAPPREVPELKVYEHPPSTLRNINSRPPGGTGAGGPGAPTINAKIHRRRAPGDAGAGDPGAPTINAKKRRRRAHERCQSW
jgi:hypothetical protein